MLFREFVLQNVDYAWRVMVSCHEHDMTGAAKSIKNPRIVETTDDSIEHVVDNVILLLNAHACDTRQSKNVFI